MEDGNEINVPLNVLSVVAAAAAAPAWWNQSVFYACARPAAYRRPWAVSVSVNWSILVYTYSAHHVYGSWARRGGNGKWLKLRRFAWKFRRWVGGRRC